MLNPVLVNAGLRLAKWGYDKFTGGGVAAPAAPPCPIPPSRVSRAARPYRFYAVYPRERRAFLAAHPDAVVATDLADEMAADPRYVEASAKMLAEAVAFGLWLDDECEVYVADFRAA